MQIAKQKLNENIAEYILYMYQIEDVIRAYQFDVDAIIERYVEPQMPDSSFINQYRSWYKDLVNQMKNTMEGWPWLQTSHCRNCLLDLHVSP